MASPFLATISGLVLFGGDDLVVGGDRPAVPVVADFTLGRIGIGGTERRTHRVEANAQLVQQRRIDFRPHRRARAAADEHLADALHLRQLLRQDGIAGVIHFWQRDDVGGQGRISTGASAGLTLR